MERSSSTANLTLRQVMQKNTEGRCVPMAARGRASKPTALKVLEGNPGKRPLSDHEPIPPKGELKCPSWLLPRPKGMEASRVLAGGDGRLTISRPQPGLRGLLSGVCSLEGSRGVHHPARQHLQNAFRLCAAGAAGQHCPAEPEDHAVFLLGFRPDARYSRAHHRRWRKQRRNEADDPMESCSKGLAG